MTKLYRKTELGFALLWIGLYVVVMNIALQFCSGFDNLENKTIAQMLVPVICILVLAVVATPMDYPKRINREIRPVCF